MVDGINMKSPSLPSNGEIRDAVSTTVAAFGGSKKAGHGKEASEIKGTDRENVSSAIEKSADERFESLVSGNVQDFLQAAEKLIDESLPAKSPGTRLRINLDADTGRFVYQGIDVETGDVVTQYPAEEVLRRLSYIREREGVEGIVVDEEA